MRICAAQTRPLPGNVDVNARGHFALAEMAVEQQADLVFFPELSLTGYEPKVAKQLAISPHDGHLDRLQSLADARDIIISVGAPTMTLSGVCISSIIFRPNQPRDLYSKQLLHSAELPYFQRGRGQLVIEAGDQSFAPAICYESLQPAHAAHAADKGSDFYLASVAKSEKNLTKANAYYPEVARNHGMHVMMANCLGPCDSFIAAGRSSCWNRNGDLIARLDGDREGVLIFDTATGAATEHYRQ